MEVVSVINYKGGVGKTTITSNIGAQLAWSGKRVLMIDLDPQTNLTFSFLEVADWTKNYAESGTIKMLFDSLIDGKDFDISTIVCKPKRANSRINSGGQLDLISSHLGLINVDLELATLLSGASMKQTKQNFIKVHRRLADSLKKIENNNYDIVLIDCPPNFNIVTKTSIVASSHILVPTKPDFLSTLGIDYLIRNVDELVSNYNDYVNEGGKSDAAEIRPANIGVVFNMVQEMSGGPISAQKNYIQQLKRQGNLNVFTSYVKNNNTLFAGAAEGGIPVVLNSYPSSTYSGIVAGLEAVTKEFQATIGL